MTKAFRPCCEKIRNIYEEKCNLYKERIGISLAQFERNRDITSVQKDLMQDIIRGKTKGATALISDKLQRCLLQKEKELLDSKANAIEVRSLDGEVQVRKFVRTHN